ncbi:carbohydrate-binding module family 21 protein [Acrodontium crateriforme]|uniref:Carbohydrate-binding module family 21 protein n=1 Tax=Acrodontium crateriforme TaxID=150365 RepID=A0AAQ3R9C1_9PEZI|nr:carbohydrate-binding module family 21 protein [Acrodontium crateriforme]
MPYTPPSQQSPSSSKSTTPAVSRSSSIHEDVPRSPNRPQPPRSMSSASYLHRHRRSPSITKQDPMSHGAIAAERSAHDSAARDHALLNGSVRQSPPPVNNLVIPTGAVLSPPDSSENSDGEQQTKKDTPHDLGKNWDQLKEAVRAIDQKREASPERNGAVAAKVSDSAPHSATISPTALSAEARKISHSRSSTENAIIVPRQTHFAESPVNTSDDSDEDQGPFSKPSLVRKKSGELVKPALRPSSRRRYSSMPGTPTYSKSVHFNDSDNQTRHFLQVDRPIAVSAGTSPVETYDSESEFPFEGNSTKAFERKIKLSNFPRDTFERRSQPIRVEKIYLSEDQQTLIGQCAVQNISFEKHVVARFTLDYWKTTSEVVAEYNNIGSAATIDGCDRFNFHIKLSDQANIDDKTLLLCVRYTVGGQEYWDSNGNANFQIDFAKEKKKVVKPSVDAGLGTRPLNSIPRSRHSPASPRRGRNVSADDDFASRLDESSSYHFSNTDNLLGEGSGSIKLKPRSKRGSMFPSDSPTNGLGGRYDFGASLSAALSTAQTKLGRQSGLMVGTSPQRPSTSSGGYFGLQERKEGPTKMNERPDNLTTDRPAMGSEQYKDLVQKFCYFTPGAGKSASPLQTSTLTTPTSVPTRGLYSADGATDTANTSLSSSGSASPAPLLDGSTDRPTSALTPFLSRSTSPAPVTGQNLSGRTASPISFGYPYHNNVRDGYLSDSHTPTAIRG